jgi:alanine-glyoxylate transaminase/serine-glyoxylate transaminase/serine-pyruvate transaminase
LRATTCRSAPGSGRLAGSVFRIGHLGFFNDLMLCATLCGVEMGLAVREVPHRKNGVAAALAYLEESGTPASSAERRAA